ncbi:hypothetical protein KAI65_03565 [Candidatus Parcubacteria bacterium]|nr:hypothetical protein [Candidatus Parcubacteria bacterium]
MKKKVFILVNDKEEVRFIERMIKRREFKLTILDDDIVAKIPNGYNFYLLHYSQTTEKAVIKLRGKNPLSYIYLKSGVFDYDNTKNFPDCLKGMVNDFGPGYYPVCEPLPAAETAGCYLFINYLKIKGGKKMFDNIQQCVEIYEAEIKK